MDTKDILEISCGVIHTIPSSIAEISHSYVGAIQTAPNAYRCFTNHSLTHCRELITSHLVSYIREVGEEGLKNYRTAFLVKTPNRSNKRINTTRLLNLVNIVEKEFRWPLSTAKTIQNLDISYDPHQWSGEFMKRVKDSLKTHEVIAYVVKASPHWLISPYAYYIFLLLLRLSDLNKLFKHVKTYKQLLYKPGEARNELIKIATKEYSLFYRGELSNLNIGLALNSDSYPVAMIKGTDPYKIQKTFYRTLPTAAAKDLVFVVNDFYLLDVYLRNLTKIHPRPNMSNTHQGFRIFTSNVFDNLIEKNMSRIYAWDKEAVVRFSNILKKTNHKFYKKLAMQKT